MGILFKDVVGVVQAGYLGGIDQHTKLLIHGGETLTGVNGVDGTTFTDVGNTGHTVTQKGGAQNSTTQYKFSTDGYSYYFDGSDDYLSMESHADFGFGTEDFFIDLWVRYSTEPADTIYLISKYVDSSNYWFLCTYPDDDVGILFQWRVAGVTLFSMSELNEGGNTPDWVADQWYHIAVSREYNSDLDITVVTLYKDRNIVATKYASGDLNLPAIGGDLNIGRLGSGLGYLHGYLDEIRISKGKSRVAPRNLEYRTIQY